MNEITEKWLQTGILDDLTVEDADYTANVLENGLQFLVSKQSPGHMMQLFIPTLRAICGEDTSVDVKFGAIYSLLEKKYNDEGLAAKHPDHMEFEEEVMYQTVEEYISQQYGM